MKHITTTTALALTLAAAAAVTGCASKSESPSSDASPGTMTTRTADATTMMTPTTPAPAAAEAAIAEKDMTHVVAKDESYFGSMPAAGKKPDGTLKAGTKVVVLMPRGGYSQVMTADGKRVYTTTAALKPVGS